jgi:hypothetical protein
MLQWLHEHYSDRFDSSVMDKAASEGHLEAVKWLHAHRSEGCSSSAMDRAAKNGYLDVLRWLHDNRTEGCTTGAMDWAAASGHLDTVKWLHEHRFERCTDAALQQAARNGHVDVLRWLVEHYPEKCSNDLVEIAGKGGHLDMVRYLDENTNQRASAWGLRVAVRKGWLETLHVLMKIFKRNYGLWCGLDAVRKAFDIKLTQLSYRHAIPASSLWREALDSLERFHSCGFFSCVSVMLDQALRRGYIALVQLFMRHRGADEERKYVAVAAHDHHVVLLRWLLESGTPIETDSVIEVGSYLPGGEYFEIAGYLSESDRAELVCRAVWRGCHTLSRWMLENTVFNDASSRAIICTAIEQAPSDTVQWLRDNLTNAVARTWCVAMHKRQRVALANQANMAP